MKNTVFDDSLRTVSHACDCYKNSNPLLMHKSFRMEDKYYRKNSPNDVMKIEFGMDAENYVIVAAAVVIGVIFAAKVVKAVRRSRDKKRMKQKLCRHG